MPETIKCQKCGHSIYGTSFGIRMQKLRKHYQKHHQKDFSQWGKRAVETKKELVDCPSPVNIETLSNEIKSLSNKIDELIEADKEIHDKIK